MSSFKYEDYRQPWETGPHWELKREFIEKYSDMFEEDRLLCLAQAYSNVVLMNCNYPGPVMRQISELSKPLEMRKRFQEGNKSSDSTSKEQQKVSEKVKSIFKQSGRPFKMMKFCASTEPLCPTSSNSTEQSNSTMSSNSTEQSNSTMSSNSTEQSNSTVSSNSTEQSLSNLSSNLSFVYQTAFKQSESSHPVAVSNQKSSQSKADTTNSPVVDTIILKKEENIISMLGLSLIQNLAQLFRLYKPKVNTANEALMCALQNLGLRESLRFEIDVDPEAPQNTPRFCSKVFLMDCEIASGTESKRKKAKNLSAENALDVLIKLSTSPVPVNKTVTTVDSVKQSTLSDNEHQDDQLTKNINNDNSLEIPTSNTKNMGNEVIASEQKPFILNKNLYTASLNDGFILVDREANNKDGHKDCRVIIPNSASFSHKTFAYSYEDIMENGKLSRKVHICINGVIVGSGIASSKEEAKIVACTNTYDFLRKKYYTLKINDSYNADYVITRSQVFEGESFTSNVLTDSNIGCKMLKNMGWTGGGLKQGGIAEPVEAFSKSSFGTGLGFGKTKEHNDAFLFKKRLEAMLKDFSTSDSFNDLVFSKEFSKEERKDIHKIAPRFCLQTTSRGIGDERYLTVRHKNDASRIVRFLASHGGSNAKFELVDASQDPPLLSSL